MKYFNLLFFIETFTFIRTSLSTWVTHEEIPKESPEIPNLDVQITPVKWPNTEIALDPFIYKRQYMVPYYESLLAKNQLKYFILCLKGLLNVENENTVGFEIALPGLHKYILGIEEQVKRLGPLPKLVDMIKSAKWILEEIYDASNDLKKYRNSKTEPSLMIYDAIEIHLHALALKAEITDENIVSLDFQPKFMIVWHQIDSLKTRFKTTSGISHLSRTIFLKHMRKAQNIIDELGKHIPGYAK